MPTLFVIIAILLFGAALVLWIRFRAYRYAVVLFAGLLTSAFDPLWQSLYGLTYPASASAFMLWERPVPQFAVMCASWLLTLPAIITYFGGRRRWWPRHYLTGIIAFVAFILYHIIIQGLARRTGLWDYASSTAAAWGLNYNLFIATLSALISLLVYYMLVATRFYPPETAAPTLIVGVVLAPPLVYGILGAPYWLPLITDQSPNIVRIGTLVTLLMVAWVAHLACWGMHASRRQLVLTNE
ncbi:MAG TPA: hypothetical protein VD886_23550 [Herpetosiphonaceae bacterium]|nr:hypothetical protein [Herpetosiphonaceae bacterium]